MKWQDLEGKAGLGLLIFRITHWSNSQSNKSRDRCKKVIEESDDDSVNALVRFFYPKPENSDVESVDKDEDTSIVDNKYSKDGIANNSNKDVAPLIEIDNDSSNDSDDLDEETSSIKQAKSMPFFSICSKKGECDTVQVRKKGQKRTDVYAMRNKKQRRIL